MTREDVPARAVKRLLRQVALDAEETAEWTGRTAFSERVMQALARVPRHEFVAGQDLPFAYDNRPLGIGYGQTISQPFIVAAMTDLLDLDPNDRVLEIGSGCGYQTAVLAELAARVFSVERVGELAEAARQRLSRLGYSNIELRCGDGFQGWPEHAPFEAIIVTAAPLALPPALADQLAADGRLVIPIGPREGPQMLYRCLKQDNGSLDQQRKLPVSFVPMLPGS